MNNNIHMIAAHGLSHELGYNNDLIWKYSDDLKRFKKLTEGHIIIMGRKTFDSLPGMLPKREHWVLTRDRTWSHDGVRVFHDIDDILAAINEKVFIIGGGEIYQAFLPYASTLHITHIQHHAHYADAFFPKYETLFRCVFEEIYAEFTFETWKSNMLS